MLLGNGDDDLLSHSMKCTAFSWAAKCGVPRELRRLLGRHATATRDASVYSRDLMITPVRELGRVLRMIRDGQFKPDNPRSGYFPGETFAAAGTPGPSFLPKTPAFLSKPSEGVGEKVLYPQPEISEEIKTEALWRMCRKME